MPRALQGDSGTERSALQRENHSVLMALPISN
jgi:hypothetical protein